MKIIPKAELVQIKGGESLYTVYANGSAVGLLTKYKTTRSTEHPWKAYRGIGAAAKYIGAFYNQDHNGNGKAAAMAAICEG